MKKIVPFLLALLLGCNASHTQDANRGSNKVNNAPQEIVEVDKPKVFPKSEFEIAEGGIGIIKLGDPFDSLEFKFKNVDTFTMSSEGIDWKAKRIQLGKGEWILAEGDPGTIVTRIHTNSPRYKTAKGTRRSSICGGIKSGEGIGVDIDEGSMSIRLYGQGISISVDSISENKFYNSTDQELKDIPASAIIDEIGVF